MNSAPPSSADTTAHPVLAEFTRGPWVESRSRGVWAIVDPDGRVLEGEGAYEEPQFARSTLKGLQVLPLLESGAADRFAFSPAEIALACASHNGEDRHVEPVRALLARLGLKPDALQCGVQNPSDPAARAALVRHGADPGPEHNNCSGKHSGFLALALHSGVAPKDYLDPESASQRLVRQAVLEMTGLRETDLGIAIDGCSAPTFRLPLVALGRAFARLSTPSGLEAPRREAALRVLESVAAHPDLIAGVHKRLCTKIAEVTRGRLFPKVGGDAIYIVGEREGERCLVVKIDDGNMRALNPVVVTLLERFGFTGPAEARALESYYERERKNWAGTVIGSTRILCSHTSSN